MNQLQQQQWAERRILTLCLVSSNELRLRQVQTVRQQHDGGGGLPAEEERGQQPLRLRQDGRRIHPAIHQPGLHHRPAGVWGLKLQAYFESSVWFNLSFIVKLKCFSSSSLLPLLCSWCWVSMKNCSVLWLKTWRAWTPASWEEKTRLQRNRRYLQDHLWPLYTEHRHSSICILMATVVVKTFSILLHAK